MSLLWITLTMGWCWGNRRWLFPIASSNTSRSFRERKRTGREEEEEREKRRWKRWAKKECVCWRESAVLIHLQLCWFYFTINNCSSHLNALLMSGWDVCALSYERTVGGYVCEVSISLSRRILWVKTTSSESKRLMRCFVDFLFQRI